MEEPTIIQKLEFPKKYSTPDIIHGNYQSENGFRPAKIQSSSSDQTKTIVWEQPQMLSKRSEPQIKPSHLSNYQNFPKYKVLKSDPNYENEQIQESDSEQEISANEGFPQIESFLSSLKSSHIISFNKYNEFQGIKKKISLFIEKVEFTI